ncbi:MAG: AEC family transporter [Succinivibrio sp.]
MSMPLINASTVIAIFLLGYFFKRFKLVGIGSAKELSYVVMYVTLPCAILSGTSGAIDLEATLYFIIPLAFCISLLFPLLGYFIARRDPQKCVYTMLNLGGFNIGNFILPFMQSILTPEGFIALCLFDVVNAFFCFGGVYCLALYMNRKGFNSGFQVNLKTILIELSKSITSYCCIISIVLSASGLVIPSQALHAIKMVGGANTFLCMFIIGVALNFDISFAKVKRILMMIFYRYSTAIVVACAVWFLLPYSSMVRLVIMAITFAPITSMAPITAIRCLPQFAEDSANLNMVSVITSVVIVTALNALSPVLIG